MAKEGLESFIISVELCIIQEYSIEAKIDLTTPEDFLNP